MIVRDEERHLEACLASLDGVIDELVVVDTGSLDRSVEMALAHGARVFHHAWTDDFAVARNVALDHAAGRWILYIDADERLRPVGRHAVVDLLDGAEEVAFRVLLRPKSHYTPYFEHRLWRNHRDIRFRGFIHEKVVPSIRAVGAAEGRKVGDCSLTLDHVGYDSDQTAKHHRNLSLLQAQIAIEPENVYNLHHLGRVLTGLERYDEAEEALERAIGIARLTGSASGAVALADLVRLRLDRHPGDNVEELLSEGLQRWPDNWLLVWIRGQVDLGCGRYAAAEECFRRLLAAGPLPMDSGEPSYDERMFGPLAYASLALCLFRMGRFAEAADAYAAAEVLEPDVIEHRVKRRLAEARAGGGAAAGPASIEPRSL